MQMSGQGRSQERVPLRELMRAAHSKRTPLFRSYAGILAPLVGSLPMPTQDVLQPPLAPQVDHFTSHKPEVCTPADGAFLPISDTADTALNPGSTGGGSFKTAVLNTRYEAQLPATGAAATGLSELQDALPAVIQPFSFKFLVTQKVLKKGKLTLPRALLQQAGLHHAQDLGTISKKNGELCGLTLQMGQEPVAFVLMVELLEQQQQQQRSSGEEDYVVTIRLPRKILTQSGVVTGDVLIFERLGDGSYCLTASKPDGLPKTTPQPALTTTDAALRLTATCSDAAVDVNHGGSDRYTGLPNMPPASSAGGGNLTARVGRSTGATAQEASCGPGYQAFSVQESGETAGNVLAVNSSSITDRHATTGPCSSSKAASEEDQFSPPSGLLTRQRELHERTLDIQGVEGDDMECHGAANTLEPKATDRSTGKKDLLSGSEQISTYDHMAQVAPQLVQDLGAASPKAGATQLRLGKGRFVSSNPLCSKLLTPHVWVYKKLPTSTDMMGPGGVFHGLSSGTVRLVERDGDGSWMVTFYQDSCYFSRIKPVIRGLGITRADCEGLCVELEFGPTNTTAAQGGSQCSGVVNKGAPPVTVAITAQTTNSVLVNTHTNKLPTFSVAARWLEHDRAPAAAPKSKVEPLRGLVSNCRPAVAAAQMSQQLGLGSSKLLQPKWKPQPDKEVAVAVSLRADAQGLVMVPMPTREGHVAGGPLDPVHAAVGGLTLERLRNHFIQMLCTERSWISVEQLVKGDDLGSDLTVFGVVFPAGPVAAQARISAACWLANCCSGTFDHIANPDGVTTKSMEWEVPGLDSSGCTLHGWQRKSWHALFGPIQPNPGIDLCLSSQQGKVTPVSAPVTTKMPLSIITLLEGMDELVVQQQNGSIRPLREPQEMPRELQHSPGQSNGASGPALLPAAPIHLKCLRPCYDKQRGGLGVCTEAAIMAGAPVGVLSGYVLQGHRQGPWDKNNSHNGESSRSAATGHGGDSFMYDGSDAAVYARDGFKWIVDDQLKGELQYRGGGRLDCAWQFLALSYQFPYPDELSEVAAKSCGGAVDAAGRSRDFQGSTVSWPRTQPHVLCMLGHGGLLSLLNDAALINMKMLKSGGELQPQPQPVANCVVIPVAFCGVVLPVVVTLRRLVPGEQLLLDYGVGWWREIADTLEVATALGLEPSDLLHERHVVDAAAPPLPWTEVAEVDGLQVKQLEPYSPPLPPPTRPACASPDAPPPIPQQVAPQSPRRSLDIPLVEQDPLQSPNGHGSMADVHQGSAAATTDLPPSPRQHQHLQARGMARDRSREKRRDYGRSIRVEETPNCTRTRSRSHDRKQGHRVHALDGEDDQRPLGHDGADERERFRSPHRGHDREKRNHRGDRKRDWGHRRSRSRSRERYQKRFRTSHDHQHPRQRGSRGRDALSRGYRDQSRERGREPCGYRPATSDCDKVREHTQNQDQGRKEQAVKERRYRDRRRGVEQQGHGGKPQDSGAPTASTAANPKKCGQESEAAAMVPLAAPAVSPGVGSTVAPASDVTPAAAAVERALTGVRPPVPNSAAPPMAPAAASTARLAGLGDADYTSVRSTTAHNDSLPHVPWQRQRSPPPLQVQEKKRLRCGQEQGKRPQAVSAAAEAPLRPSPIRKLMDDVLRTTVQTPSVATQRIQTAITGSVVDTNADRLVQISKSTTADEDCSHTVQQDVSVQMMNAGLAAMVRADAVGIAQSRTKEDLASAADGDIGTVGDVTQGEAADSDYGLTDADAIIPGGREKHRVKSNASKKLQRTGSSVSQSAYDPLGDSFRSQKSMFEEVASIPELGFEKLLLQRMKDVSKRKHPLGMRLPNTKSNSPQPGADVRQDGIWPGSSGSKKSSQLRLEKEVGVAAADADDSSLSLYDWLEESRIRQLTEQFAGYPGHFFDPWRSKP